VAALVCRSARGVLRFRAGTARLSTPANSAHGGTEVVEATAAAATAAAAALDEACGKAMNLQLGGRLDLAERLYRTILQERPSHAVANHCLGMVQVQLRRPAEGLPFLLTALNSHPEIPEYWLGYLEALFQNGQIGLAQETLALAQQHGLAGKAVEDFASRLRIALRPPAPEPVTPTARGNATSSKATHGRHRNEMRILRKQDEELTSLLAQKRHDEAVALARAITERFPEHGLGWKRLGALLWWKGLADEALIPMEHSVRLLSRDAEAHSNFGLALLMGKRRSEAMNFLRRAIEIDSRCAAAHYHLGLTYILEQRYAEAEASLRAAVSLRPDYLTADVKPVHSDLLFLMSHNPSIGAASLFAEHRRFGELVETPLRASSSPRHSNSPQPERRLRIGFVSGDFVDHSVAMFLEPVVARLNRSPGLELHAYHNRNFEDAVTTRLRGCFQHWHSIFAMSDADLAKRIMDDGIDILVDLYGHTGLNRLRTFAHRPAPVQVSWLGYPGTTGLQAMDYYLADRQWLPPGRFDHLFTEKLAYLPDRWAFEPHADAPAVNELPALESGRLTFGSFHRMGKLNASTLRLWSDLLTALPHSTLLLAAISPGAQQETLIEGFAAHGIAADRLRFHDRCGMSLYLGLHHQVDIALDAHPYAGATTSMHSLSMGVPTLTIAGTSSMGRAGAGIMGQAGLDAFVATDAADFVEKGCYWAEHLRELAELRAGLRARLRDSPGGQPDLIAAHLEAAFRHMWRRWCAGLPAVSFSSALETQLLAPAGRPPAPDPRASIAPALAAPSAETKRTRAARRQEARILREQDEELSTLIALKRIDEALVMARAITERFPEHGLGWKRLGALLWWKGLSEEAFNPMENSVRLLPRDAEAHNNFGTALLKRKRGDDAVKSFRRAIDIDPRFAAAHYHLGIIHLEEHRFAEAEASLRVAVSLRPDYLTAEVSPVHSDLLFLISHNPAIDAEALFAEYRKFGELLEAPLRGSTLRHSNVRDSERQLRIGFVSGDYRDHSVAMFLEPVVARLNRSPGLELHGYHNRDVEDLVTARLRACFKHWHPITALSDVDLAKRIADDGIDILVDLSGHTAQHRLRTFARKPAPIQASWLGYPGTTGLRAMDYYIADRHWLSPGQFDHLFTEKLAYLPDRWAFEPHAEAPAVNALPALETGRLTFGSFHRLSKINASTLRCWSQLLLALPHSTLLLAAISPGSQQETLIEGFAAHGIAASRLRFHDRCRMSMYLGLHHHVDIALDTHPYAGGTTTMYSLSMGVPTLTIAGASSMGRAGAGIMGQAGLDGFVATDAANFVERGRYWSDHLTELAELRAGLRRRLRESPGGQPDLIAAHLEAAFRHMWRRWCAGLPAESFGSALEPPA
jgi:predicted O-linked N-acetylglucosamine transferase (SPINDLY family)